MQQGRFGSSELCTVPAVADATPAACAFTKVHVIFQSGLKVYMISESRSPSRIVVRITMIATWGCATAQGLDTVSQTTLLSSVDLLVRPEYPKFHVHTLYFIR